MTAASHQRVQLPILGPASLDSINIDLNADKSRSMTPLDALSAV